MQDNTYLAKMIKYCLQPGKAITSRITTALVITFLMLLTTVTNLEAKTFPNTLQLAQQATPVVTAVDTTKGVRETTLAGEDKLADLHLSGLNDRQDVLISVPASWALTADSYIEVKLSHSPLLIPQTSNLTLLLNNQPLSSVRLDTSNQNEATWKVILPTGTRAKQGQLQFGFTASMRTNDLLCPPTDDGASWVVISTTSKIRLNYTVTPPTSLSELPQFFFGSKALIDRNFSLVIPEKPTNRDLTRASQVMARLGSLAGYDSLKLGLEQGNLATSGTEKVNQILVGGPAIFPLISKLNLPIPLANQAFRVQNQPLPADVGIIQLAKPAQNDSRLVLLVSGGNDEAVDRAVQSLLDNSSLGLMRSNYALIQPGTQYIPSANAKDKTIISTGKVSLADLGFENQNVSGTGAQSLDYFFTVPSNETVSGDAKLTLDYSFSGIVDPRRSSLTIVLNDIAVQAIPLNSSNTVRPGASLPSSGTGSLQLNRIEVILPKDLLRSGENRLTTRFGMYITRDLNTSPCGDSSTFNNVWGTIYRSSELEVKTQPNLLKAPDLSQLPLPFAGGNTSSLVVIPDAPARADLQLAAQLVAELGRNDQSGEINRVLIVNAGQVDKSKLSDNNLILIGTPENNSLLKQANPKLPLIWNSDTARTLNTQRGLQLNFSDSGLFGLVEIIASPWNDQRAVMAIMANSARPAEEDFLVPLIARQLYIGKYSGNILAVDGTGKAVSFNTLDKAKPTPAVVATASKSNGEPVVTSVASNIGAALKNSPDASTTPNAEQAVTSSKPATKANPEGGTSPTSILIGIATLVVFSIILIALILFVRQYRRKARNSK